MTNGVANVVLFETLTEVFPASPFLVFMRTTPFAASEP